PGICGGKSGMVQPPPCEWSPTCGPAVLATVSLLKPPRMNALKASRARRTISTFSSDIAHAVSRAASPDTQPQNRGTRSMGLAAYQLRPPLRLFPPAQLLVTASLAGGQCPGGSRSAWRGGAARRWLGARGNVVAA